MNDRPLGVSILAVLHILGGLGSIVVGLFLLSRYSQISSNLNSVGISMLAIAFGVVFLIGLMLASGIGMSLGTRWGWWCTTFAYIYDIASNINVLVTNMVLGDELTRSARGPEFYILRSIVRTALALAILLYFFKPHIQEYFGVEDIHKGKAIGLLIGATVLVVAVMNGTQLVFGG
jgi:hypothetical protein